MDQLHASTHAREPNRKIISAHVDLEERERLYDLARREDRSVSAILRRAVRHELERSAVQR